MGGETQHKLIAAASDAFRTVGFHGTNTNKIARAAGFAPQTFYRHFADKRAIFLAVYDQWARELIEAVTVADTPAQIIGAVIAHHRGSVVFRGSLLALVASDAQVRALHATRRARQLDMFGARLGGGEVDREALMFAIWSIERVADGIAFGEAEQLGLDEQALTRRLESLLGALGSVDVPASPE